MKNLNTSHISNILIGPTQTKYLNTLSNVTDAVSMETLIQVYNLKYIDQAHSK